MLANIWNTVLFNPILNIVVLLYHYLGDNLGLAILVIAFIVRLILIPLTKRQNDMTKKMANMRPELEKLQKQYANNKEKLSQEQVKLYRKMGYNPLGCLGTFIPQLIVLSVLIGVIRAVTDSNLEGLYTWVRDLVGISNRYIINPNFLFWDLTKSYNGVSEEFGRFALESLPYIGLAVLVGVVQYFTTLFTQKMQSSPSTPKKKNKKKSGEISPEEMQAQMQKSMAFIFPLMTVFLTISMPAALGWYWMIQSLLLIVQYFTLDFDKTKRGVQNLWNGMIIKNGNKLIKKVIHMKKKLQKQLDTLLKLMGIDTHYDIEEEKVADTTYIKVSFKGENLGYLIGGHGRHLDSLQFILNLMLRKEFGEDSGYRVLLDVADYRKGRDEKLEKFAMQKADDARILGEPVDLPPMKASDRRVIHIALEKFDDIKTESVGEDRDRHIRIIPVSDSDILEDSGSETEEEESEE